MAIIQGTGTNWNLLNYSGDLFTADKEQAPLLSMIGGLTGGMRTTNFEFPTSVLFDYPEPKQPEISEQASITAPAPTAFARTQEKNVVQIHQEAIDITYVKQSNMGRMSGLNTAGQQPNPTTEMDWQISRHLIKVARDVEKSFIEGKYQESTSASVANKTRGLLELTSTGTTIDAGGAPLSMDLLKTLYREMANNGAYFNNMVMMLPAYLKQMVSAIYEERPGANLPATRNVGGVDFNQIQTDFFTMGVVWNRFMPEDSVLLIDVAHLAPVFQEVPGKGVLFLEDLAKVGASDRKMLFGQIGLAHGPSFLHGSITGLSTDTEPAGG